MEQQNEHHGGIQPPPDCPQLLCQLYNLLLEGNWKRNWPKTSAANRLIGEVAQLRRRPLLGPSPG